MITFLLLLLLFCFIIIHLKTILNVAIIVGIILIIYYIFRYWDTHRSTSNIKFLHLRHKTMGKIAGFLFLIILIGNLSTGANDSSQKAKSHPTHTEQTYHHVQRQIHHQIHPVRHHQSATKARSAKTTNSMHLGATQDVDGSKAYRDVDYDRSTLSDHWTYDHIHYSRLDSLNRAGTATAYLDSRNVTNDRFRQEQFVEPSGWHQKRYAGKYLLNRGHEIAYSLSKGITNSGNYSGRDGAGDQNNLRNLFTQTQFSNQDVQTIFESEVRNALENGDQVIYQVTPIFHGDNLMASGVHMQARSTNQDLNFNVYLYNTQPGVDFDYSDGTSNVHNSSFTYHPYHHNYQPYYHPEYHTSNYSHHWSPATREKWRRTMYMRHWRYQ